MDFSEERLLMMEYKRRYDKLYYYPLKIFGFWGLDFKNEYFKEKSKWTSLYNIFLSFVLNLSTMYILYVSAVLEKALLTTEIIVIIKLTVISNCLFINNAMTSTHSRLLRIINFSIKIDTFLDVNETKFMRNNQDRNYEFFVKIIALVELIALIVIFSISSKYSLLLVVALGVYFAGIYSIFYKILFMIQYGPFLNRRVHYLNLILMKLADIDDKYLANILPEKNWEPLTDHCKIVVDFRERTEFNPFPEAFRIIFEILQEIEKNSRFEILLSIISVTGVTFATVQIQITMFKSQELIITKTVAAVTWVTICWFFLYFCTQRTLSMLIQHIHQTKTICCYILLNPSNNDYLIHLAKSVLRTVGVRDSKVYIYGLFSFDTRFLMSLISAIFLYITILLQFEFPVEPKQNFNNKSEL